MGTTRQTASGTRNSLDGNKTRNKTPYSGMVDSENRNQARNGRELAVGNKKPHGFPFPYRAVPVPTTFSRPDF